MNYVAVAYALTFVVVGVYAASITLRRREVERSLRAWSERRRHQSEPDPPSTIVTPTGHDPGNTP